MGSCVSSSHNQTSSDSAIKLAPFISKPDTTSPVRNDVITPATIYANSLIDSGRRDSGNKEEMIFFDSRGWLDSDCDDDFMSVDGEFTPSRGTTPVHHKFCDQTRKADEDEEERKHEEEPSPTDNKKRLLQLFKETQDDEDDDDDEEEDDVAEGKARACLWLRTPVRSSAPAHRRCVPRLVSCSSFTERRRKMMTHAPI